MYNVTTIPFYFQSKTLYLTRDLYRLISVLFPFLTNTVFMNRRKNRIYWQK